MFIDFIACKNTKYSLLINKFLKKYQKNKVYSFFNDLKESGLFYFDTNKKLKSGQLFELKEDDCHIDKLKNLILLLLEKKNLKILN